jgi:hypothetical protein
MYCDLFFTLCGLNVLRYMLYMLNMSTVLMCMMCIGHTVQYSNDTPKWIFVSTENTIGTYTVLT